jgi:hypothetical protein
MKRKPEPTRVREQGTRVTRTKSPDEKIAALRDILEHGYAKIDGVMVDLFSASAMVKVYDALNDENKIKFAALPIVKMAKIAFQLVK